MSTNALTIPVVKTAQAEAGGSYVNTVILCLLLVAVPFKNAAYLVPPAFIVLQALAGDVRFVARTLFWASLGICLATITVMIDSLAAREVNLPGLLFGFLSFASLAVILGLRSDFTISPAAWQRLKTAVAWFVILQSLIGFMQFAASRDPDAVCGTFGLLDFRGGVTIAQVYLTFNLFAMVMYLLTDMRGMLAKTAIVIGLLACALAHSGHQTVFFIASLFIVGLLQMRFKDTLKLGVMILLVTVLLANVAKIHWSDIGDWYSKAVVEEDSPKKMVTRSALEIMSSPKNLFMGVGLGQYSSRAALISSGTYLTTELPAVLTGTSAYYRDFVSPARYEYDLYGETSAISAPYCSALNIVVELGLPLAAFFLFIVSKQLYRNWCLAHSTDPRTRAIGLWANVGLVFFVLCCFIENYLEFPQAIFVPALLYVAAQATARRDVSDRSFIGSSKRGFVAGEGDA